MGIPPRFALHARDRHGTDRRNDPRETPPASCRSRWGDAPGLILALALALPASAETIRVATFNTELQRDGPGLFLRDILDGDSSDIDAAVARIVRAAPDILLLQGIDYDHGLVALAAFAGAIAKAGHDLSHHFALAPNSGVVTGLDLDDDGRIGPRDAQGYGRFAGQGGLAILSRHPVISYQDHSALLWSDLQGSLMSESDPGQNVQRLSSVAHWTVSFTSEKGTPLHLLAFHATPPVFDGPEDRNGRRNHDEAAFWTAYLDGMIGADPPRSRFVILGDANLDPMDGDGRKGALAALLMDARLQDPAPASSHGVARAAAEGGANARHRGDPALDTANWRDAPGPGNLRVDYILPSVDWTISEAGILWPDPKSASGKGRTSRHGLLWVDLVN